MLPSTHCELLFYLMQVTFVQIYLNNVQMFNVYHTVFSIRDRTDEKKMRCVDSIIDQASVFITLGNR